MNLETSRVVSALRRLGGSALLSLSVVAFVPTVASCARRPEGNNRAAPHGEAAITTARPKVELVVPGDGTIPEGPEGDLIRRGRVLATRTFEELPELVGSELHCTSCHLEGATRANAGPWVGLSGVFPEYRPREGRTISLEDRIDSCFERSLDGKAPPRDGPAMRSLVAYIDWLSRDVPRGSEVIGRGFSRYERPPNVDSDNGRNAYAARCASCHGSDGEGRRGGDGTYQFPPLWGDPSFNIGAGMARLDTAAAFVRHNMPLGQPESVTVTEAYDIASYVTQQPRPDYAKKNLDWPHGGKPSDARY